MMCEEAQAFLQSTFERELTDFLVNHEDRYQLMNVPPERRLEAFKALVRQHLLSFLLLENLSVDVDKELKEKLDWLNQHNYDPVITPQKPLLDSILEDINRRQITRKPVTSFLQTVKGEDERPNPATQPSLFSGSVDPFQASAGGSNSFITPSKKPVRPSNSNAKT